jgi:flagellar basal body rod protein FlgG
MRKLEVQNNNLANLNTVGFKRQYLTAETQGFENTFASLLKKDKAPFAQPDHVRTPGVENIQTRTDFAVGPIKNTGNPLDVALRNANEFFVVNTPEGPMYTRAGNFAINGSGELVTQDGMQIQGEGGAVAITGPGASISADGSVRVNREAVGRLQVVRFTDPGTLERVGGTRFKLAAGQQQPAAVEPSLEPQALEMSNASAISSMVDMIVINRAFEAYTKAAQTIDGMNQSAISQIGKRQ